MSRYNDLLQWGEWKLRREAKRKELEERHMKPYRIREAEGARASSFDLSVALNNWLTKHGGEMVQSCASCRNMRREGPAFCDKFGMTPPIDVIQKGCEKYEDESDIPF